MRMRRCDRCPEDSPNITTKMSFFNTDTICEECQTIEEAHPLFQLAKDVELQAYLNGDWNYPGIGLPEDYGKHEKLIKQQQKEKQ